MASSFYLLSVGLLILSVLYPATAMVHVWGIRGYDLEGDAMSKSDPYVKVYCGSSFGGMTEFIENNANPSWTADFIFQYGKAGDNLVLEVWDKDVQSDDLLGSCPTTVISGSHLNEKCYLKNGMLTYNYSL